MRPHFQQVLDELNLLAELAEYEATIIGTPPLDIEPQLFSVSLHILYPPIIVSILVPILIDNDSDKDQDNE